MILKAQRPLIMLGAASSRPKLVEPLSNFVRRTRIPFFNTQMGKGSVTGGSNLYVGTAALSSGDYVHRAIDHADLIIAIGHDTVEKPPFLMGPKGPKVIHVAYTAANVEQVYFPHAEVIGDVGASLALLADRLEGKLRPDPAFLGLRSEILERIRDRAEEDRFPVTPQRIVHDVRKVMPEDGIVCLDNGMYKIWFARNYRTHVANTLLLDNALATMGAGLPSAMMAAMLYPKRRVLAVCGDGGFMMNSQEMETAVRLGLNLVVLILEDSAYGMIRWKQAVDKFPDWGLTFGNPGFRALRRVLWRHRSSGETHGRSRADPGGRLQGHGRSPGHGPHRLCGEHTRPRRGAARAGARTRLITDVREGAMNDLLRVPCVLMRGGTSKGPYFLASDLPLEPQRRDQVLLAAMGSGHWLEIDGIGGGNPLTSKIAIVSPSKQPGADVDYLFAQVKVEERVVDTSPNCGNMLAGIGPFAIEAGLVPAQAGTTTVRIYNVNTKRLIEARIATPNGTVTYDGDVAIDGVPGTAAPVHLAFLGAAGIENGKASADRIAGG